MQPQQPLPGPSQNQTPPSGPVPPQSPVLPEAPTVQYPAPLPDPATSSAPHPNYDFIMNQNHPPKKSLLSGRSMTSRILVLLGGLLVLVIAIIIVKDIISGSGPVNVPSLLSVAQDQQELLHLTSGTTKGSSTQLLSANNQNFVATTTISITSEENQLLAYLTANGKKTSPKQLDEKISTVTDDELTNSIAAATYDQTFTQVMQSKLTSYKEDLTTAYNSTKAVGARTLLKADYTGATLLLKQLSSPDS